MMDDGGRGSDAPPPFTRCFFGRLPPEGTEEDLEKLAAPFGRIKNMKFKGNYGFVEFVDPRDARDCVRELDGSRFMGSRIGVEAAKGEPYGRGGGDGGGDRPRGGGGRFNRGPRMLVKNLPPGTSWQDLKDLMKSVGDVKYANIENPDIGLGVVEFADPRDMQAAKEKFRDSDYNGSRLVCEEEDGPGAGANGDAPPPRRPASPGMGGGGGSGGDSWDMPKSGSAAVVAPVVAPLTTLPGGGWDAPAPSSPKAAGGSPRAASPSGSKRGSQSPAAAARWTMTPEH